MGGASDRGYQIIDQTDLEGFFENALAGFLITDSDGAILKANTKFAQWIGTSPQNVVGKRFSDYLSISGKIYVETHLAPLLRMQGAYDEIALELTPAEGPRIPVLLSAQARLDENGIPTSILMVFFKSTVRRQYEHDLLAARNELRELNANLAQRVQVAVSERLSADGRYNAERETAQLREQFIAVLGHDLRNPLAAIDGGLKILSRTRDDGQLASIIGLMQKSVERMSALVSDLMDFARGRMGNGLALQREPVDLEQILRQVFGEIVAAHPEKTIDSHVELVRPIVCDPFRIAQLLSNLIGNAIAHGDPDGTIRVSCVERSSVLQISVANTGAAIPPDTLNRLFQPFVRSNAGPRRHGLGLGLYISSEIARAHHGELRASSTELETVFTFTMPTT